MENKKCLHCGKDLTEADILHFNEFCSLGCLNAHRTQLLDNSKPQNEIDKFDLVRNIEQIKINIITLDRIIQQEIGNRPDNQYRKNYAIELVYRGRHFIPYKIGNSERRTVPSKFVGYVANSPEIHREILNRGYRNGEDTNKRIDCIIFNYLGGDSEANEQQRQEYLNAHETYCADILGHPAHKHQKNFWPLIPIP